MAKTALITGASEGIGRALCMRLANDGYAITAVARSEERLASLIKELGPSGGHEMVISNLSDSQGVDQIVKLTRTRSFDLFVNNAGVGLYGQFHEGDLEAYRRMMRLNMDALVTLSHAYLSKAKTGDALINVSSVLSFMPFPDGGVYAATKSFVTSFTESLWFQMRPHGVYVMNLCPGVTRTKFQVNSSRTQIEHPPLLTQTAEQVVETAIRALRRRTSPTVISGFLNRVTVFGFTRFFSRKFAVVQTGRI